MIKNRQKIIPGTAILLALTAIVLLSAGISGITVLDPGTTFFRSDQSSSEETVDVGSQVLPAEIYEVPIMVIALLILVPFLLFILIMIFVPKARGRAIRNFLMILMWAFLLYALNSWSNTEQVEETEEIVSEIIESPITSFQQDVALLPEFNTDSPDWLVYLIGIVVILGIAGTGYYLYLRSSQVEGEEDLELLANEAQSAIDEIQAGGDFRNAILRCYSQMCIILRRDRGLYRSHWMTPREFEQRMLRAGLPRKPVAGLTQLFEFVRYAGYDPDSEQETLAIDYLDAIAAASESSR